MVALVADGRITDLWKELGDTVKVTQPHSPFHAAASAPHIISVHCGIQSMREHGPRHRKRSQEPGSSKTPPSCATLCNTPAQPPGTAHTTHTQSFLLPATNPFASTAEAQPADPPGISQMVQTLAIMEIFHSGAGLVRAPISRAIPQVETRPLVRPSNRDP